MEELNDQLIVQRTLTEGRLRNVPDFYKSMSYNGTGFSRLRGLEVNKALPKVVEIVEGTILDADFFPSRTVYYSRSFKNVVSVNGLLKKVNGRIVPLYPGFDGFYFDNNKVVVGSEFHTTQFSTGDSFKLRVYSIDL